MTETVWALEVEGARLEVQPSHGGRVTSLRSGELELLSGAEVNPLNFGSTFWTSPQSAWGWPPPAAIDGAPYAVEEAGEDAISLIGAADPALGVRVRKRIARDRRRSGFVLTYSIENVSAASVACAPWEITRVRAGGTTFFPARAVPSGSLPLEWSGGLAWYTHDPKPLPVDGWKAFGDGSGGLLAHLSGDCLHIKRFAPVSAAEHAPGEAAIEVYACPRYVEVETQGPYAPIAPGASRSWTVEWYVRRLPTSLTPSFVTASARAALVAWAESISKDAK